MKTLNTQQARELDARTIREQTIGEILMDRAGLAVAASVLRLVAQAGCLPAVLLVAGKGNNGGDAFAAARYLAQWGLPVKVLLAGRHRDLKGDARFHYEVMTEAAVPCLDEPEPENWQVIDPLTERCGVVVDGLLGTGSSGKPRGACAAAIAHINRLAEHALVVSIDLPSGMDGNTGQTHECAVRADLTVTMGHPKRGFLNPEAHPYLGSLEVADIGLLPHDDPVNPNEPEIIAIRDVQTRLPPRRHAAHKGDFGHVLLAGGATGYSGAIGLAGLAALRTGCGLATILTPASIAQTVAAIAPELMVRPCPETPKGALCGNLWPEIEMPLRQKCSAILVGPGLTISHETRLVVDSFIFNAQCPVVLDADALNTFAGEAQHLQAAPAHLLLTPHPGELARLLGTHTAEIQADRCAAARHAADLTGSIVVLKGAGTVIAEPRGRLWLNLTGNPGMATGGAGDVLAGMLAGLLATGLPAFDAACCAVWLHGLAGDTAALKYGQAATTASNILESIPAAMKTISPRG